MERTGRQARSVQTQFRAVNEGSDRFIEGYFAVFNSVYEMWPGITESVDSHAFDQTLADDIRALIDHRTHLVLGRNKSGTLELKVDSRGLWGRIKINQSDQDAQNLYARVDRGDVDQCSFGFDIVAEEVTVNPDGSAHWILKTVKLYEVSVVTFPAYEDTAVTARKKDLEQLMNRQVKTWREQMKARIKHGTQTTGAPQEN
jgi:hypothetical protein